MDDGNIGLIAVGSKNDRIVHDPRGDPELPEKTGPVDSTRGLNGDRHILQLIPMRTHHLTGQEVLRRRGE